ncbi:methyl-accepting chemotaxis protein [Archangium sp.]|uniref:methyl-accepting chemotaxis protein n=1 Tax=Archangium sp. TaxID=1872627 RepID=UPI002D388B4A|nr:methyl-accepting chemotaxis protein [Archangium sp.]HYO53026.1 methyl-accepting chemotaxis protein [Archangium sp.]
MLRHVQASSSSNSLSYEPGPIVRRMLLTQQLYTLFGIPPLVYLMILISGLDGAQALDVSKVLLPVLVPLMGIAVPYLVIYLTVRNALREVPGEPPGARLMRILEVPGAIDATTLVTTLASSGFFVGFSAFRHGKSLWTIPWAMVTIWLLVALLTLQERVWFEKILRPYALAEFHKNPGQMPRRYGFLWPRQVWFLPYAFAVFVACSLTSFASIVGRRAYDAYEILMGRLDTASPDQVVPMVRQAIQTLLDGSVLPLVLVGAYLLISSALAAWFLAQRQTEGTQSIQRTLEGLVYGKPRLPDWVSTDEVGDLSATTARVFEQLKSFSISLQSSAQSLRDSAEQLGLSTTRQTEVLTQQAAALQETQVTAQEIKHTSVLASQKADGILKQTERADQLSVSGETALQQGLTGMQEIGAQVREMATSIRSLDERARQIAHITTLVKGLADRSNMLALNAAIEAVRSGEAGKGFGVVAREIRTLADQSIKATRDIGDILQDLSDAIGGAVNLMEQGSERVEVSLRQIRDFSTQVQQISNIVQENASSVRQITVAVGQQDVGIAQIFEAVSDLSKGMDQTMSQLRASDDVLARVRGVAEQVSNIVDNYGWQRNEGPRS